MSESKKPQGWGKDSLSEFIETAQNNELATFDTKRHEYNFLREVDDIFQSVIQNLINTEFVVPSLLYMRSHSAYRGACRLILSSQLPESYVLARSCLEYAMYALHMCKSKDIEAIWVNRHDSKEAEKTCRNTFRHVDVISTLNKADKQLGDAASELYDNLISHGGHPNEKAITHSLRVPRTGKGFELKQLYLHGDSEDRNVGLVNIGNVGLCSLFILRIIWRERFDIIGATDALDKLNRFVAKGGH